MYTKQMNILITGSTSGLGEAIYKGLLVNAQHCLFTISKNKKKIKKNKRTFNYICDLSSKKNIDKILKKISYDSKGKIDVIICNAASGSVGMFENIPTQDFEKKINTNFISHLKIIKKFYKRMRKNNFGHIINISSGTAIFGIGNYSSYSVSKSCMQNLIESLYNENKGGNIYVKNFFPGIISTNFSAKINNYSNDNYVENIYKKKNTKKVANYIIKNIYSKSLNNFCQTKPFLSFIIKIFPFLYFSLVKKK